MVAQRNLQANVVFGGEVTRTRARIGWRIPGFVDSYSDWTPWRTGGGTVQYSWQDVVGGVGGLVVHAQAEGPDGGTESIIAVRFETDALLVEAPQRQGVGSRIVRVRGYGMTGIRYRTGFAADPRFAPNIWDGWQTRNVTSRSGRIGSVDLVDIGDWCAGNTGRPTELDSVSDAGGHPAGVHSGSPYRDGYRTGRGRPPAGNTTAARPAGTPRLRLLRRCLPLLRTARLGSSLQQWVLGCMCPGGIRLSCRNPDLRCRRRNRPGRRQALAPTRPDPQDRPGRPALGPGL